MDCSNCGIQKNYNPWINDTYVNNCPNKCETECEGPVGPKNIPIFNTTYVGRARRHIPDKRISYYDCSKQRGGSCGSADNIATDTFKQNCSAGRCETNCDTSFYSKTEQQQDAILLQKKNKILRQGSQYTGTSKRSEYARYVKTTPGFETFSSKKVASLQSTVQAKQNCFVNYWCDQL